MRRRSRIVMLGDAFDGVDVCRLESCNVEEVHAAHPEVAVMGRAPRACPTCFTILVYLDGGHVRECPACGWRRVVKKLSRRGRHA